jgi:hypothetical protein
METQREQKLDEPSSARLRYWTRRLIGAYVVSLFLILVWRSDFKGLSRFQSLGLPSYHTHGLPKSKQANGIITDSDSRIIQVMLKGHEIKLGITLNRLIDYLGQPNGPDGEEADEFQIIITYYIDGDYYYFYFSPSRVLSADDAKLVYIYVTGGW